MKILIVTGRLAEGLVRESLRRYSGRHEVHVEVMPIEVAALATTEYISSYLKAKLSGGADYDLVMIPGMCRGSAKLVERELGVRAVKGPVNAADIPSVLEGDLELLSPDVPADSVLRDRFRAGVEAALAEVEARARTRRHVVVGGLVVPADPPPIRVVSEITEAHAMPRDALLRRAERLVEQGADVLSLGFEAGVARPDAVREVVRLLKKELEVPIAVDSVIPSEIAAGVDAGADMVMSLEAGNVDKVASRLAGVPAVVIPYDSRTGSVPRSADERVRLAEDVAAKARKLGVEEVIVDLVLDPPNASSTFESMLAYYLYKRRNPEAPMLMGIGNVVELMDADSVGANALLTMLALEIGASMVLVVEKSDKAQGSTMEVATASRMASVAWLRRAPPKDLGIDLLVLKDKRRAVTPLNTAGAEVVRATERSSEYPLDPVGYFKIRVNHDEGVIEALYVGRKGRLLIKGRSARAVRDEILRRGLVTTLSHAFYLGIELGKAEEALAVGKSYVQEQPLFRRRGHPFSERMSEGGGR